MDFLSKAKRSALMATIRSRRNKSTELALVRILRSNRITGWRRHVALTGRPDFAFKEQKLTVFVDGCFWHGCPKCYRRPRSNRKFWEAKVARNRDRDREVNRALHRLGWRVIRFWEHDLKRGAAFLVPKIQAALVADR